MIASFIISRLKRESGFFHLQRISVIISIASYFILSLGARPMEENLTIRNFRHGNGLADAQVNCIMKDSDGFIWLGSPSDIQRFDGIQNTRYTFYADFGGNVNTIFQMSGGRILVGTDNGIGELHHADRSIRRVFPDIQSSVRSFEEFSNGMLIASDKGLYVVSPDGAVNLLNDTKDYFSVRKGSEGEIYLLSKDGLETLNGTDIRSFGNGSIGCEFTSIADMGSYLLLGTSEKGIYAFDKKTKCFSHYKDIGNNHITAIATNHDILAVGTAGTGLFIFPENNQAETYSIDYRPDKDGLHLAFNSIRYLVADNLNIIWIGYNRNVGFDYIQFKNKAFRLFSSDNKLPIDIDYSRAFVTGSLKLFATFNGLYSVSHSGNVKFHPLVSSIGSGDINVTSYLPYGENILVGTTNGLYIYSPDSDVIRVFDRYAQLNGKRINTMSADKIGNIMLASDDGLFMLKPDGTLDIYTSENSGLDSDRISYVFVDSKGIIWVATDRSIYLLNSEKHSLKTAPASFCELSPVSYISEDRSGNIIMISQRRNAFIMNKEGKEKRMICSSEDAGFLGLFIEKVLQDNDQNFWFIGSRGVVKGNPTLTDYTLFSSSEGFVEPYSNDGQIYKDTLWITTPKGVLFTNTNATLKSPPTRITDLIVNGESRIGECIEALGKRTPLLLSDDTSNLTFVFATLSYDAPDRMIYEYKLEGSDDKWKILRGINQVSFHNLPSGDYTFVVRKQMDDTSIQKIPFRIGRKSRSFTLLFSLLSAIIALTGIGLIFHKYHKRKTTTEVMQHPYAEIDIEISSDNVESTTESETSVKESEKYRFNKLKDDTAEIISNRFKEYMIGERPYLNPNLKLVNVAEKIEVSPQVLSQVLNTCLNIRFNDFVNQLRIDRFKECVNSFDSSKYTLQTLAKECGFSSYSTFFRAFKELTGQTPNDYIKGLSNIKE